MNFEGFRIFAMPWKIERKNPVQHIDIKQTNILST
jgi:hypothetical protein